MTPTMPWRLYAGNLVAPLRRQSGGALTPTMKWRLNDENSHMAFRAPDCAEVGALRDGLTSFANTSTDKTLLDLVIAAQVNGRDAWLDELVKADTASPRLWRRKRAIVLNAFRSYPSIDNLDWPEGEKVTS
jgi:hypothetical protein